MNGNERWVKHRPIAMRRWLSAIDPGLIRLQSAGRAALALLSIWLVWRTVLRLLPGGSRLPIPLFGVLFGIVFLLFIIDLKPSDRKVSLWLAPIPFVGAFFLASFLTDNFWLNNLILLLLFFFSYFFRRYGTRAGELALVTTVGFYIGFLLHPPQDLYLLFMACVIVSLLLVYLWLFVIIPYDPAKSLQRSVSAFYHNVARTVAITGQGLDSTQGTTPYSKNLQRRFRQVHLNRRMIEGLFSAVVSPALWSQARLNHLQEEMFKTERGLELLVEAAGKLSDQLNEIPDDVLHTLIEGLSALENQLWETASGGGQAQLAEIGDTLHSQLKSSLKEKPPGEWAFSLLRVGVACRQIARSVVDLRTIEIAWNERTIDEIPGTSSALLQGSQSIHPVKKPGGALHPTTILGLQAVLATGLSMLAAYLLKMDQPNLVYWTAFIVIAGSTGESLRRMTMRVIGVIAGTLIGVFLAIIIPDNLPLLVFAVTICLFMTVYTITTSYIWMVFWLNIAMLLIITTLGGAALQLLVLRPVSTLLGAAIAALVVVFVLPIHVQNRFIATLTGFLKAVDRYIEIYSTNLISTSASGDLRSEELNIDLSYKKLELTLPAVTYEYNPLSRAQSRLASQATSLAVLKSYITHLNDDVGGEAGILVGSNADLIQGIQSHIHANVIALNGFLTHGQGDGMHTLSDFREQAKSEINLDEILTAEAGSVDAVRNRAVYHLARIHDTILQIASGLGAPVASS